MQIGDVKKYFSWFKEIKNIEITTQKNITNIAINLTDKKYREQNNQLSVFELEEKISEKIATLKDKWIEVRSQIKANWPWWSSPVGIKIESNSNGNLQELIRTAKDFENFINSLPGTKNIANSSQDTPGQFIFRLKKDLLASLGISPQVIYQNITQNINGITIGSVKDDDNDIDIILKNSQFHERSTPDEIANIVFSIWKKQYRVGEFIDIIPTNSISNISRKNGNIQISLSADIIDWSNSREINKQIITFAENYNFPKNIYYVSGGAQNENSDLIFSMITALIVSLAGIFAVLTWQFNSYKKPLLVFFSVFMAIPFVLLWLFITNNPYSMMFGIGFIALMGISVNHGIILLEWIDQNIKKMNGWI